MSSPETVRVRDVSDFVTKGTTPTTIGRGYTTSGVRFLKVETFTPDGSFIAGREACIDLTTHQLLRRSQLAQGDILFSIAGALGRSTVVEQTWLPANTNQAFAIIRPSTRRRSVDPRYLLWQLRSPAIITKIAEINVQAAQANLSLEQVRDFEIPIVPLPEQEAIATALDDIETLIAKFERQIAKRQAIKQGLMQQLLVGRTRLPGCSDPWLKTSLGEVSAFITKGATPTTYGFKWESAGVPFLRSECVSEHGLDMAQAMFISTAANQALRRSQVTDGDILMTITGYVGRVIRLHGISSANINQHIARIRIKDRQFAGDFVYHYLSQPATRAHYETIVTGQAYPQISLKQVRETELPALPIKEQRAIAAILSDADQDMAIWQSRLLKARAIKQGMMQQLLTGRTRLPVQETAS